MTTPDASDFLLAMTQVGTEKELRSLLVAELQLGGTDKENALADGFVGAVVGPETNLELTFGGWTIRDDDLELFKVVRDATLTLAAASFVITNLPLVGITGLAMGVATLLRNAYRNGARLTPQQSEVVVALRHAGKPVTADALADILNWRTKVLDLHDGAEVKKTLEELLEVPTKGKGLVALVQKTKNDEWLLVGV